ncbi:MAG: hypothetical protein M3400_03370, partial [Actinomycetota bacterium]|nr:hypothetical protein [Actinomycetota bacterium]
MPATLFTRSAGLLAVALTLSLSACAGDDAPPSATGTDGGGSASGSAGPVDVCEVVSAEEVGSVLALSVEAEPFATGCGYTDPDADDQDRVVIDVQQDAGGGLDTARVESEADLGGTAQPLDVGGNQGYVVLGMRGET